MALGETRLHPVAPLVVRVDDGRRGRRRHVTAGCAAGVWLHAVHRDETAWENLTRALERWLTTAEERRADSGRSAKARDGKSTSAIRCGQGVGVMPAAGPPRACTSLGLRAVLARLVCAVNQSSRGGREDPMTPSVGFTVTPANAARVVPRWCIRRGKRRKTRGGDGKGSWLGEGPGATDFYEDAASGGADIG